MILGSGPEVTQRLLDTRAELSAPQGVQQFRKACPTIAPGAEKRPTLAVLGQILAELGHLGPKLNQVVGRL